MHLNSCLIVSLCFQKLHKAHQTTPPPEIRVWRYCF